MLLRERRLAAGWLLMAVVAAAGQTPSSPEEPQTKPNVNSAGSGNAPNLSQEDNPGFLPPGADPENRLLRPFVKHMAGDQVQFWTGIKDLKKPDALKTFVPFAAFTSLLISTDSWVSNQVPDKPNQLSRSKSISDYALFSFMGAAGGSFALGHITHNDRLSETGLLAGEAALNSTLVAYAFKEATQRQRPFQGNGHGDFFQGGTSFPAEHAAIAWSVASVVAHQYPGTLTQIAAYGLASAVTVTRVTSRQHFASDAFVGSVLGWYFGRQVYRAHHDPEIGGAAWGGVLPERSADRPRNANYMASPYVPLDSWIYPAFERLIGLGYVRSNILGMRPWTRMACARLLEEAADNFPENGMEDGVAGRSYGALRGEFKTEIARWDGAANIGGRVDSVYTRMTGIFGTPVRDGYHFGQTISNDFGRPYGRGFNDVTGASADAQAGPVSVYIRGEYQHSPASPSESTSTLAATAAADFTPPLADGAAEANQFRLLDSMASVNFDNLQISFGRQSVWLGPDESGALLMSDNAAPFLALKIDDVVPHRIPGLSRILGPFRTEYFVGQLSGHHWEYCAVSTCQFYPGYPNVVGPDISPQPFIHGEKISFQPTANFEFGMGITAMFGGPGLPVTFGNYARTYYTHSPNAATNPGKRISAADFTYRMPGLRSWLTFYMDALVVDEVSPIGSSRATVNPGIYLPQIPKIPRLELRAEGVHESTTTEFFPGFVYYDQRRYLNGYTNDGNLMGSWIGRAGRGGQGWLTYWLSARNQLQFNYRQQMVSPAFVGGGRLVDYSVRSEFMLAEGLSVAAWLQYEAWRFPVLAPARQSDVTASVQVTFRPHWEIRKR
jgi:hypothetical protein